MTEPSSHELVSVAGDIKLLIPVLKSVLPLFYAWVVCSSLLLSLTSCYVFSFDISPLFLLSKPASAPRIKITGEFNLGNYVYFACLFR